MHTIRKRDQAGRILPSEHKKATCHPDRQVVGNGLCGACYQREWRKENPEKRQIYQRRNSYGVSPQDFDRMMAEQNYRCAICRQPFGEDRPSRPLIEHDHNTGFVRGLVHYWCNTRLTAVEDKEFLGNALRYLEDAQRRYDEQGATIQGYRSLG